MVKERISRLVGEAADRLGYMVYEFSVFPKGENSQIIVKIDSLAGISHQDCENYSRELTGRLDEEEIFPNYSLEVSSPGLHREVRNREEFIRFAGAPVKIVYRQGEGNTFVKGTIGDVTGTTVTVSSERGDITVPFDIIVSSHLDY